MKKMQFDFEDEYDDCNANEPAGGYPEWQKKTCGAVSTQGKSK
jgi:hypothetical protein